MTGPGAGDEFVEGFLDDYFAESEEHVTAVRRALLSLEEAAGDSGRESGLLEELFRSFHSLKGLSAMVDVREAEQLAHELESYLRLLRDGDLTHAPGMLAVLIDATAALEGIIESRRTKVPSPDIAPILERLAALGRTLDQRVNPVAVDRPRPDQTWQFVFVPTPSLVERGVKVDTIRQRLAAAGHIARVAPKVLAGGGIAFEFEVVTPLDPSAFEPWRDDGMTWERVDASGTAPAAVETAPYLGAQSAEHSILAPSHVVRVDLKRLDAVMRRVADLVVTRARLDETLARVEHAVPSQEWRLLQEHAHLFERQLRDLRTDVMRVRLVRVDEIFRRMPFVARDIAREAGKDVRVALNGKDTEIDKYLVERMMDPVLHLVRNAVSHGIESPGQRERAGKPRQGLVTLSASTSGERVLLTIADDGGGIDVAAVADRARAAGVRVPDAPLDSSLLLDVLCEPGFSTRDHADRASGRGVGMTVVRTTVQELGGTLALDAAVGRGTRFTISLPLTLAITDALIAVAGTHRFAVPQSSIEEVIEIDGSTVRAIENNDLIPYRGRSLPLLRLRTLFDLGTSDRQRLHAFVIGSGQDAVALGVDRILGQREVVVRTLADPLLKVEGISGATELGDGRVVLMLDVPALSRRARRGLRLPVGPAPGGSSISGVPA